MLYDFIMEKLNIFSMSLCSILLVYAICGVARIHGKESPYTMKLFLLYILAGTFGFFGFYNSLLYIIKGII
jgi:hypothetical protein